MPNEKYSSNSLIRVQPDQSVECKIFNYEKEINSSIDNPTRESADLGEYLDFRRSHSKYTHSRKASQSVYSISKFRDKSTKMLSDSSNKRRSGVIQKNNPLSSQKQKQGDFGATQLVKNSNNIEYNRLEGNKAIATNQIPIREITNLIQNDDCLELDNNIKLFKSMDNQMAKSSGELKSLSDIDELCIDASESVETVHNPTVQQSETKGNTIKKSSMFSDNDNLANASTCKLVNTKKNQFSHTKSMQNISNSKLGVNLRKMTDAGDHKPAMTFGNKTGELKSIFENSEIINSPAENEHIDNSQYKSETGFKHTLSNNTIGLLKEIEDIDDEIRGLLSLIAKH